MKTIKRLLLTILVLLMIVTAGVVTFAVTPLSSCRFSGHVVSNVSAEGVGRDTDATACLMDRGEMQRTRERAFFSKCPSLGLQFIGTAGAALFNRFPTVNPSKPGNMISKITTSF